MASKMSSRILAMGVMASSLVLGGATIAAAGPGVPKPVVFATGGLTDFSTTSSNPTDGAKAKFLATAGPAGTHAVLIVKGLPPTAVGSTFGAHVHTGPCVTDQPATAGPHYRSGGTASPADPQHEIWLDFTVLPGGVGVGQTTVPFTIAPGAANSVVIHAMATGPGGVAGPRLACLPVQF